MEKAKAIELLGGSVALAAKQCGLTSSAVSQWPEVLPPRIVDRVQAALWRKEQAEKEAGKSSVSAVAAEEASHG